jgi:Skp family chaperone for outer membrane proteins
LTNTTNNHIADLHELIIDLTNPEVYKLRNLRILLPGNLVLTISPDVDITDAEYEKWQVHLATHKEE